MRALIAHAAGSLTQPAPRRSRASHKESVAPVGSLIAASLPAGGASVGGTTTAPPAPDARVHAASRSSTATYVFQNALGGPPRGGSEPMPATSRPRSCATKYLPGGVPGISPGP